MFTENIKKERTVGQFNGLVVAEFHPPLKWILTKPLSYTNKDVDVDILKHVGLDIKQNNGGKVTVPTGFATDLASVPRAVWWLISPWDIARAAIIHDLLYKTIRQYRWKRCKQDVSTMKEKEKGYCDHKLAKTASDQVFLMAMLDAEPKVPKWKIYPAYWAVVLFGRWSITPSKDNV